MKKNQIKKGVKNYPHDPHPMLPLHFPSLFRLIWYTGQAGRRRNASALNPTIRKPCRRAGNLPGEA